MKLTAAIMVKNEVDVIRDCCGHLSALFDNIIIIDHLSTDGTKQYLEELARFQKKFHVFYFVEPGYYQSQLMTWVARNIPECSDANWVFLLDADEVLPFKTREGFESALSDYESVPIIKMPWKNLIPKKYSADRIMGRYYFEPKTTSIHHKIAYQPALLPIDDFIIAQGNHAIYAGSIGKELPCKRAFNLYHIPIRSDDQLLFKVNQGTLAYKKMGGKRDKKLGTHWFEIAERIEKSGMDEAFLNGLAFHYGESTDVENINFPYKKLLAMGADIIQLNMALDQLPNFDDIASAQVTVGDVKENFSQSQLGDLSGLTETPITMNENKEISFITNDNSAPYIELEQRVLESIEKDDIAFLATVLQPSVWKIESLTPTAWGGHIPFLFSLVTLMKPRVYTELGSYNGASFFAACQAIRKNNIQGKAVAIDLWQGDEHAGYYGEAVFNSFKHILSTRYFDVGEYLRMSFDEASKLFENSSIDLLHIDGLHTYEAVKNDYETWRSKLTDNGVIIFHDTNVFERGFGVYQLWDEIREDGTSYNFKHTHGLGVLAFGTADENPVVRLLEILNGSVQVREFIELYFCRLGELSNLEAIENSKNRKLAAGKKAGKIYQARINFINSVRQRLINFVKSIPVLRRLAYKVLRYTRG